MTRRWPSVSGRAVWTCRQFARDPYATAACRGPQPAALRVWRRPGHDFFPRSIRRDQDYVQVANSYERYKETYGKSDYFLLL
jgi:hypothetical protein